MWAPKTYVLLTCVTFAQAFNLYPPPKEATIPERPFHAAIFLNGNYHCSAAIISQHCVLTACSCVGGYLGESNNVDANFTLVTHTRYLQQEENNWEKAIEMYTVDGCNRETNENDAAILCSDRTLQGRPQTMVAQQTRENVRGIVSGWGISVEGEDDIRDYLQRAYMRIISLEECRERYEGIRSVPDSALCAMAPDGVRGFCAGDIGGPLTHGEGLIGVSVASFGCDGDSLPGIFTNVSRISASVQAVVKKFEYDAENRLY